MYASPTFFPLHQNNLLPFFIQINEKIFCFISTLLIKISFIFLIRACPLATLGVGLRLQVRGRKPWGRKAAKRASKVAFLPPRPQRLPPLRAFHLRPHASQVESLNLKMESCEWSRRESNPRPNLLQKCFLHV